MKRELAGVIFSDSNVTPVLKFLNPDTNPTLNLFNFENPTTVQTRKTIYVSNFCN